MSHPIQASSVFKNSRFLLYSLPFLTALLHPLCFPDFDQSWLAWIVLVPLHWVLPHFSPRRAFTVGWLVGTLAFAGTIPWVITAMNQFGQLPFLLSAFLMLLLATYLGLYWGIYAWGCTKVFISLPGFLWIAAPSFWVALEYLRTYALTGFPWALLGYSQYQWLSLIQFADITGVYGVSFLIILTNMVLTSFLRWGIRLRSSQPETCPWQPGLTLLVLFLGSLWYGQEQREQQRRLDDASDRVSIGLVQANIAQDKKWDETYRGETLSRYTTLSAQVGPDTDLLLWPEAATPFFFEREPFYQQKILEIIEETQNTLIFGSPTLRFDSDKQPFLLNSAYVLTKDKYLLARYDKRHLVPFGEYIPLKSVLFFLEKLVVGIGDFRPGQGPLTITLPQSFGEPQPTFGVAICFEVIFPDLVRQMAQEGANFLITITNDAWFGQSVAPYQHFGMVIFRAIENHLAFARSANTGVSGFIAPDGRILSATPIFSQEAVGGHIPLRFSSPSFYTRFGDVFSWGCVILSGILLVRCRRRNP